MRLEAGAVGLNDHQDQITVDEDRLGGDEHRLFIERVQGLLDGFRPSGGERQLTILVGTAGRGAPPAGVRVVAGKLLDEVRHAREDLGAKAAIFRGDADVLGARGILLSAETQEEGVHFQLRVEAADEALCDVGRGTLEQFLPGPHEVPQRGHRASTGGLFTILHSSGRTTGRQGHGSGSRSGKIAGGDSPALE
jgi:hypothetical protein